MKWTFCFSAECIANIVHPLRKRNGVPRVHIVSALRLQTEGLLQGAWTAHIKVTVSMKQLRGNRLAVLVQHIAEETVKTSEPTGKYQNFLLGAENCSLQVGLFVEKKQMATAINEEMASSMIARLRTLEWSYTKASPSSPVPWNFGLNETVLQCRKATRLVTTYKA
ncbi:uncharacterized protein LOC142578149 [Dermacentor variabilis]|uniref:uncharacterized protein LOC142578149 n=1 Tax=Dermacentor variabilis TaxID=34621 RepID=UPI003F5CA33E